MSPHRIANRAKATRGRAAYRRRRSAPRNSVAGWLGVGALTLGMGVAVLAGGSGVAHADRSNDAAPSKGAGARSAAPTRAVSHESSSSRESSVGAARTVAHAAVAANNAKRVVVAPAAATVPRASSHPSPVAISQTTAVHPVAAAAPVRQSPVQAVVGVVVNALVALGGLDPVTPEPAPGNLWQLGFYSVARWLADAVNPAGVPTVATTSVGTPDLETGVVAGRVLFSTAAGDPLTYRVTVDPTQGTATINPDGSFSFTPLQAARLGDGPVTVKMLVTAYHGVQKTSSVVTIPLPKAAFAVPAIIRLGDATCFGLALSPNGNRLVVQNKSTLSVIDTATNTRVSPDIGVGDFLSTSLVFSPDGSALYSAGPALSRLSLLNNTVLSLPAGAFHVAVGPANTPAAGRLYLTELSGTVPIIDTATNTVLPAPISVGQLQLSVLAVSPDGQHVYVGAPDIISVISTVSNTVTATIPLPGTFPSDLVVNPSGKFVYVSGAVAGVRVIDTATNTVTATIPVGGSNPEAIAVSPDGSVLYVANYDFDTISAISTATNTVIKTFTVHSPTGVAVSSTRLYVSNVDGTVTVFTL